MVQCAWSRPSRASTHVVPSVQSSPNHISLPLPNVISFPMCKFSLGLKPGHERVGLRDAFQNGSENSFLGDSCGNSPPISMVPGGSKSPTLGPLPSRAVTPTTGATNTLLLKLLSGWYDCWLAWLTKAHRNRFFFLQFPTVYFSDPVAVSKISS